ncbi:MAG: glycosyltransferase [Chthonomonadales bacterium]
MNLPTSALINIIVPVYNGERYLSQTVESVLKQSRSDWRLLLVDDGSTDTTPQLAKEFAESDPRISVIIQENRGLSAARNTGIKTLTADCEYVAFLDADDLWKPEFLQTLIIALERDPAAVGIHCVPSYIDADGNPTIDSILDERVLTQLHPKSLRHRSHMSRTTFFDLVIENCMVVGSQILRRSVVDEVGLFDEAANTHEDWDYWVRAARRGNFLRRPEKLMVYRRTGQSMSTDKATMERGTNNIREKIKASEENSQTHREEIELAEQIAIYRQHDRWSQWSLRNHKYIGAIKQFRQAHKVAEICRQIDRKYRSVLNSASQADIP